MNKISCMKWSQESVELAIQSLESVLFVVAHRRLKIESFKYGERKKQNK